MRRAAKIAWGVVAAATLLAGEETYNSVRPDTQAEKEAMAARVQGYLQSTSYQLAKDAKSEMALLEEYKSFHPNGCLHISYQWNSGLTDHTEELRVNGKSIGNLPSVVEIDLKGNCDGASVADVIAKIQTADTELAKAAAKAILGSKQANVQMVFHEQYLKPGVNPEIGQPKTVEFDPTNRPPRTWSGKFAQFVLGQRL